MAFQMVEVAMMDSKQTRGFLNCNPGNMDRGEPPWNGEIRDLMRCANDVQRSELTHGRFCVFVDAPHGIRAIVRNLWAYHERLGCRTIRDYINRWAPPNENNTAGYIARVAASVGGDPDAQVDIHEPRILRAIVEGIISVDAASKTYNNDNAIDEGLALAGAGQ